MPTLLYTEAAAALLITVSFNLLVYFNLMTNTKATPTYNFLTYTKATPPLVWLTGTDPTPLSVTQISDIFTDSVKKNVSIILIIYFCLFSVKPGHE